MKWLLIYWVFVGNSAIFSRTVEFDDRGACEIALSSMEKEADTRHDGFWPAHVQGTCAAQSSK